VPSFSAPRLGKIRSAQQYLERALDIESKKPFSTSKADTHLNMCAVLSQLGKHDLALGHAQNSIMITQANLLHVFLPKRGKKEAVAEEEEELYSDI